MDSTKHVVDRHIQCELIGSRLVKADIFTDPIAYYDDDCALHRIVPAFSETETDFYNDTNTIQVCIKKDVTEPYNLQYRTDTGLEVMIDLQGMQWTDGRQTIATEQFNSNARYVLAARDTVRLVASPRMVDEFTIQRGRVKHNIILVGPPPRPTSFAPTQLVISHKVKTNLPVAFSTFAGVQHASFQTIEQFVIDAGDDIALAFNRPTLTDVHGNNHRIYYDITYVSPTEFMLAFVIDAETLVRSDITYPLVIDPTSTSVSAVAAGGNATTSTFQIDFPQTCSYSATLKGYSGTYRNYYGKMVINAPDGAAAVTKSTVSQQTFTGNFSATTNQVGTWSVTADARAHSNASANCTVYYCIPEVVGTVKFRHASTTYSAHAVKTTDTLTPVLRINTAKGIGCMRLLKANQKSPWMVRIYGTTRGVRTTNMPPDCGASCTGSCSKTCLGSCTGTCTGTCTGGCGDQCDTTCYSLCADDCEVGCADTCSGCTGQCTAECSDDCEGSCVGQCRLTCIDGCADSCVLVCKEDCEYTCRTETAPLY